MIDAKNTVVITGGLVADPEVVGNNGNIFKLRVAVDYAGQEKGGSSSGYFDVTYYANEDNPNTTFVKKQVTEGKLKKGSQISILGKLVQERWTTDDKKNARVVVVAENISYAGSARTNEEAKVDSPAQADLPENF